jgi:signal transduction histidine kinase
MFRKILRYIGIILLVFQWGESFAQTKGIESLRTSLYQTKIVENKLEILIKLCELHNSIPDDSFSLYISQGEKLYPQSSLNYLRIHRFRIPFLAKTGDIENAILLAEKLLKAIDTLKAGNDLKTKITSDRIRTLIRGDKLKEAIREGLTLLQVSETSKDTANYVTACTLLGWANMELNKYADAVVYLEKGKKYTNNPVYFAKNPALFNNLASCYNNLHRDNLAFENIKLALFYSEKGENLTIKANAFYIRADMHIAAGDKKSAQTDLEEGLKIRQQIGDEFYIISDLGQLAYFYASTQQFEAGIDAANNGIIMAKKKNQLAKLIYLNGALAENYKAAGMIDKYAQTLSILLDLKDTLYHANNKEALAALQNKLDMQTKDYQISKQEFALNEQKKLNIGLLIVFILSITLLVSLYFNYKNIQKRKIREMISRQEKASRDAISNAEENERKRIAADLHDNIGAHVGAIKSSIKYLKDGIYNQEDIILQLEQNASEMVNHLNDTIWILKEEKLLLSNLSDRFKLWIRRYLVNYPHITYEYSESIEKDSNFSPNSILHLFYILKESVNNSIKHSEGNLLKIEFKSMDGLLEISISDNGKGMHESMNKGGNGINNMKQRAETCHSTIEWKNNSPKGTTVSIKHKHND